MRTTVAILAGILMAVALSAVSIWFSPSRSDFSLHNSYWNGSSDLRKIYTVNTISSLNELSYSSASSVLLVIPQKPYSERDLALIREFVLGGGTILLADDFGYGNTILSNLGVSVRFSQAPLVDPLFYYRDENFPRILDISDKMSARGVTNIVLNHAGVLLQTQGAEVLASSSKASFLDTNGNKEYDQNEPQGPFAVAASLPLGKGMLNLVSDSSIPINAAVGLNDNLRFLDYMLFGAGPSRTLMLDRSHLLQTRPDIIANFLASIRQTWSQTTYLLIIAAVVFSAGAWKFVWKGAKHERIR